MQILTYTSCTLRPVSLILLVFAALSPLYASDNGVRGNNIYFMFFPASEESNEFLQAVESAFRLEAEEWSMPLSSPLYIHVIEEQGRGFSVRCALSYQVRPQEVWYVPRELREFEGSADLLAKSIAEVVLRFVQGRELHFNTIARTKGRV